MMLAILAAAVIHLPRPVYGDFQHNGLIEVAEVVPSVRGKFNLVIRRGRRGPVIGVIEIIDAAYVSNLYVTKARPGRRETWCGKGGGGDDDPCPSKYVTVRRDTLDFGMSESSESVAIWDGRRFEVVLLSD
jgi:hypothetical protein